mgnify:CR=1 FL=1
MDSKPEVDYLKEAKAVCDELKAELGKEVIQVWGLSFCAPRRRDSHQR